MRDFSMVPQTIPTLADARPGDFVMVRSVLAPYRPRGRRIHPDAGEELRCTYAAGDRMQFERADGSTLAIARRDALTVRVEPFEVTNGAG